MSGFKKFWFALLLTVTSCLLFEQRGAAQSPVGIPEPGLILYGTVNRLEGATTNRLTSGLLTWQFQQNGGGPTLAVVTRLTNNLPTLASYLFELRFETLATGLGDDPSALNLQAAGAAYDRSLITLDGEPVRIAASSLNRTNTFTFGPMDRGLQERVDLELGTSVETYGQWSQRYFGNPNADPNADPDGDGLNNLAEFKAGTDPTSESSVLMFVRIRQNPVGAGLELQWLSATNKSYKLERATSLTTGFTVLQSGVTSTPLTNTFTDTSATSSGTYFYRLSLE